MSFVQRLRLFFERNTPETNNNAEPHSPVAKNCFSVSHSINNQNRRHSFFKSLQLSHSRCAYCSALKKAVSQESRKSGGPLHCTSSTLKTVGMQNQLKESNRQKSCENGDAGNDSDDSDCVITEPNLRVNEGVEIFDRGRNPRGSTRNSRHRKGSKPHEILTPSAMDAPPVDDKLKFMQKENPMDLEQASKVSTQSMHSSSKATDKESNDDVRLLSPNEMETPTLDTANHLNRKSSSKRSRRGRSLRVPAAVEVVQVTPPDDELDVQMRDKCYTMDSINKCRYHSELLIDVPYYQIYNQKALDRDMAQLHPKIDHKNETRYPPRLFSLEAKRSMKSKRTISSGAVIDDIAEEEETKPRLISTRSLADMASDLPFMDESEERKVTPLEASKSIQPESPTTRKAADGFLMQEISAVSKPGGIRWAHMPQVMQSDQFKQLSEKEIQRQEALFEIITSEASYYRSLTVLLENYVHTAEFNIKDEKRRILQQFDKHILFSNIEEIYNTSERFFCALESRWLESPIMDDLCDIVRDFAHQEFACFVTYLKNQHYQNNKYNELMKIHQFSNTVKRLQVESACKNLPLDTFLLLPMQRIMRLLLLVKAVKKRTEPQSRHERSAEEALGALEQVLKDCDREKNRMHKKQRIMEWCNCIDFRPYVKMVSLGDRQLVKLGELDVVNVSKYGSSALKRSFLQMKLPITTVLLLDDYVLLTKKRKGGAESNSEGIGANSPNGGIRYMVEDACLRTELLCHCASKHSLQGQQLSSDTSKIVTKNKSVQRRSSLNNLREPDEISTHGPYTIHLILRPNSSTQCDYQLDALDYVNMERWLDAFASLNSDNKSFTDWVSENCTQAVVNRSYLAAEDDELDLKDGEIIVILRDLPHGWSKGMTQDNRRGWFPNTRVTVIENEAAKMKHEDVINPSRAYNDWVKKCSVVMDDSDEQ